MGVDAMRSSNAVFLILSLTIFNDGVAPRRRRSGEEAVCKTMKRGGKRLFNGVRYEGRCRDVYEDGVCALGERLFLRNGSVLCDCDEGWLRHGGRCYQESTPAFCGENEVLNLGSRRRLQPDQTFSCFRNPCGPRQLGHRETWENRYCHDVSEIEDVTQCDLSPANTDTNGSPMKCCSAENRSTCRRHNTIVTGPARSSKRKRRCRRGYVWSRNWNWSDWRDWRCVRLS